MRRIVFVIIFLLCFSAVLYAGIYDDKQYVTASDNRHNLSIYSTLSVKATNEKQICIFCHTPHNAMSDAPLWNHELTTAMPTYTYYWTATMNAYSSPASAPEVNGYSKLCLSCHDGTVALGAVRSRVTTYGEGTTKITMNVVSGVVDASGKLIGGPGYVGTDLSGNHPISFEYNAALAAADGFLNWPVVDTDVKLYPTVSGKYGVQCTSCHDPHNDAKANDPGYPGLSFWRKVTYEEVCDVCHSI